MGAALASAFVDPEKLLGCEKLGEGGFACQAPFSSADWGWGLVQCCSLMLAYGVVLYHASTMLADGAGKQMHPSWLRSSRASPCLPPGHTPSP